VLVSSVEMRILTLPRRFSRCQLRPQHDMVTAAATWRAFDFFGSLTARHTVEIARGSKQTGPILVSAEGWQARLSCFATVKAKPDVSTPPPKP
jgi:hypothetical protein